MPTTRINAISATATSYANDDYLAIDGDVNGTRRILSTLFSSTSAASVTTVPATSASAGQQGSIAIDSNYLYVYDQSTSAWRRIAIAAF